MTTIVTIVCSMSVGALFGGYILGRLREHSEHIAWMQGRQVGIAETEAAHRLAHGIVL